MLDDKSFSFRKRHFLANAGRLGATVASEDRNRLGDRRLQRNADVYIPYIWRQYFAFVMGASILFPRYFAIPFLGFSITPINIVYILTMGLCLHLLIAYDQIRSQWVKKVTSSYWLVLLIVLFVIWQFACDALGERSDISYLASQKYLVNVVSGAFIGSVFFLERRCRKSFNRVLLVCLIVVCAIGIFEKINGVSFLSQFNLSKFSSNPEAVSAYTEGNTRLDAFRAAATFTHPIVFGQFVAAVFPLAAIVAWKGKGLFRLLGVVSFALIPLAIVASGSRSPIFVLIISAATAIFLNNVGRRNAINSAMYMLIIVGLGALFYFAFADELLDIFVGRNAVEMGSTNARSAMLQIGLEQISSSPIFGFGAGMSALKAGIASGRGWLITIDNFYLSAMLDFGFVGLVVMVLQFLAMLYAGWRFVVSAGHRQNRWNGIALVSIISGILVGQYVISIIDNLFYVYLAAGYFMAVKRPFRKKLSGWSRHDSRGLLRPTPETPCGPQPPESSIFVRQTDTKPT